MSLYIILRDGMTVLGQNHPKYGFRAMTYANRTQAERAASREPFGVVVRRGRPFYVKIDEEARAAWCAKWDAFALYERAHREAR